ncbi:MAG: hypothetical protein KBS66_04270 [Eubacterium sp.]|nr:hypothetical protein [Candidatus Colimonas fimequi]
MRKIKLLLAAMAMMTVGVVMTACGGGSETAIHVAPADGEPGGDGTAENPYTSMELAAEAVEPGTTVVMHGGEYAPFVIDSAWSGTAKQPVTITAAEGEDVIVKAEAKGDGDAIGIFMVNVDNITLDGIEVIGGTHGIYYESNSERGDAPLENITISNCTVHEITGTHGICVYACNDLAPVKNLSMIGCEVYNCRCDSSESTVFNGNIDGFTIAENVIHDNNNIGIDMIGFEGNAKHPEGYDGNENDVDFVRNGVCRDNVVYNISAFDNEAYNEEGEYDLCADGIYVDGGQDIEIFNNFIYNCDIGIEIATEHSPEDNELFKVSGMNVHDNVIAGCMGWCGLCFGGYDYDLGFTEDCDIHNNTFVDNDSQIGIQRSKNNKVHNNLFVGSDSVYDVNTDIAEGDIDNDLSGNIEVADDQMDEYLDGFASKDKDNGSAFTPDQKWIDLYDAYCSDGQKGIKAAEECLAGIVGDGIKASDLADYDNNVEAYLNAKLAEAGMDNASVQVMSTDSEFVDVSRLAGNGTVKVEALNDNVNLGLHLRYKYGDNTWSNAWVQDVTLVK